MAACTNLGISLFFEIFTHVVGTEGFLCTVVCTLFTYLINSVIPMYSEMKEAKYKIKCCVPACTDRTSKRHRFPKNLELCKSWVRNISDPKLEELPPATIYHSFYVCNKHFHEKYIVPGTRRGLHKHAVPTLYLPMIDENVQMEDVSEENECQAETLCSYTLDGPSKEKHLSEKDCSTQGEKSDKVHCLPTVINGNIEMEEAIEEAECNTEPLAQYSYICSFSAGPATKKNLLENFHRLQVKRTEELHCLPEVHTMSKSYCSACKKHNCNKKFRLPNPNKPDLQVTFEKWLTFIDNPEYVNKSKIYIYNNVRVCSVHFQEGDFITGINGRTLKYFAIPKYHSQGSVNIDEANLSKIPKPKQNDINAILLDKTAAFNDELLEFYNSLGHQSGIEVVDRLDESSTTNTIDTNDVTEAKVSNDTNKIDMKPELPLEDAHQKVKENKKDFFLTVDNVNVVCRTCLKQKECKDLFSNCLDDLNFAQILEMFTSLKLDPQDGFSINICNDCISELTQCYSFRQKCQKSQHILEEFKSELEKTQKRNLSRKYTLNISLLDHDYEHTNHEAIISKFAKIERDIINDDMKFDDNVEPNNANNKASKTPKYVKRYFYVLKSNLNENMLTDIDKNLIEINEEKAQLLIQKSADSHQKIFLSEENVINSELVTTNNQNTSCTNTIKHTNILNAKNDKHTESPILKNCLTTRRNKFNFNINIKQTNHKVKMLNKSFSDAIQKAIKLVLEGRIDQANKLAKIVPKLPLTGNRRRRKPKERKNTCLKIRQVFPGNCRVCDIPLLDKAEYSEHAKATKHYFIDFTCDLCGKVYSSKHQLINHKLVHTNEKRFMCEKCGLRFRDRTTLGNHMKVHLERKVQSFDCKTCGDVFKYKSDLIKHRRVKHIEKKFCCEICGTFLINRPCLMQHKKRMHMNSKKPEQCFICGKGFSKFFLKRHMRTHVTDKVKCKLCNCTFKYQSKHTYHMKNRHPGADENTSSEDQIKMVDCFFCEETCHNKQSVSIHMSEVHDHLVCKYCDRIFQTYNELSTHYITHSDIKDSSCRYCGKIYDSWADLYVHLSSHSLRKLIRNTLQLEEKSYSCQFCSKCFLYKSSVQIHERTHTGERPYVCDVCGKGNICLSSFKRHKATHLLQNGQKIF